MGDGFFDVGGEGEVGGVFLKGFLKLRLKERRVAFFKGRDFLGVDVHTNNGVFFCQGYGQRQAKIAKSDNRDFEVFFGFWHVEFNYGGWKS